MAVQARCLCGTWGQVSSTAVYSLLVVAVLGSSLVTAAKKERPIQYQIYEETRPGQQIGNLLTDAGLSSKYNATVLNSLTFTFLTQTVFKEYFNLEERTGKLKTKQELDRDQICPEKVSCDIDLDIAVQPVQYFQVIKVKIRIIDINDNDPKFPQRRIQSPLSESTVPGILFPVPPASDPDSPKFGVARYELLSDTDKFELQIRETSDGTIDLHLLLNEPLDREKEGFYQVQVVAYDGGTPPRSGHVTIDITVVDINDNSPRFLNNSYEVKVPENVKVNTTLLKVQAKDPDAGMNGEIEYGFTDRTIRAHGESFGINPQNGAIFLKRPLDSTEQSTYSLAVTAKDKGPDSLPTPTKVVIHVIDINDHAPVISVNSLNPESQKAEVPENADVPYFVAHISVVDHDVGANALFNCTLDDPRFNLVQLYDTEFKVMAVKKFDRELQSEYTIFIVCTDEGDPPRYSAAQLTVVIKDINDNAPAFTDKSYFAAVEENRYQPFIVRVSARDRDTGPNGRVTYSIEDDAKSAFTINPQTGEIRAIGVFDREAIQSLEFTVMAVDNGFPKMTGSAEVLVTILDQDDQPPRFTRKKFVLDIEENCDPRTEVGKVEAIDADLPPNNKFEFSLDEREPDSAFFVIDPTTGIISTDAKLDREIKDFYSIKAVVNSVVMRGWNDTADVMIHVTDVNDNSPVIDFPNNNNKTVLISNRVPGGYLVTKIVAHDDDFGQNKKLSYVISEGNEHGEFTIGPQTGDIFVNTDLHKANGRTFKLVIMVRDMGEPQRISVTNLYVTVNETVPFVLGSGASSGNFQLSNLHMTIIIGIAAGSGLLAIILIVFIVLLKQTGRCCSHGNKKYAQNADGKVTAVPGNSDQRLKMPQSPQSEGDALVQGHSILDVDGVNIAMKPPPDYDELSVTNSNSGSDSGKMNMDSLPSPANGEKDSDSGCCADMSNTDSTTNEDIEMALRAGQPSILKIKCYHPQAHRRPPSRQSSFSDWVMSESQNLRQNGHVYRVAESNRKAVRFSDHPNGQDCVDPGDPQGQILVEEPEGNGQPKNPARTSFQAPTHHQHIHRHRNFVDTIPEEPESASETNSVHLNPPPGEDWNDGSLV